MMIKRVSLALVALGLSASAFAGHPAEAMLPAAPPSVDVTIPQQQGSWSIGVEGLYLEPVNGDFNYAITDVTASGTTPTVSLNSDKVHAVDPDHAWGWDVDLTYHFPGNGRDVQVDWLHQHDDSNQRTIRRLGTSLYGIAFPTNNTGAMGAVTFGPQNPGNATQWDSAIGKVRNDLDSVDLVFGQKMNFHRRVSMRVFGGLRFAMIDERDKAQYFATNTTNTFAAELKAHSEYEGIGPRAGANATIRLNDRISIVGTIAGSMLVGNLDQKLDVSSTSTVIATGATDTRTEAVRASDQTRVVPEWDARIGLNYTHMIDANMSLAGEVGYQTINYYDVTDAALASYSDTMRHQNDYGLRGPYVRLQLDVA